jgi:hypothetical protein
VVVVCKNGIASIQRIKTTNGYFIHRVTAGIRRTKPTAIIHLPLIIKKAVKIPKLAAITRYQLIESLGILPEPELFRSGARSSSGRTLFLNKC